MKFQLFLGDGYLEVDPPGDLPEGYNDNGEEDAQGQALRPGKMTPNSIDCTRSLS
jgi:hypothetical protein